MSKNKFQLNYEIRQRVEAEARADIAEKILAARDAAATATPAPAAPPPPPAPPPAPTPLQTYEELQRTNPYEAAQYLLNNRAAVVAEKQARRGGK
jgi:hypothetical protein